MTTQSRRTFLATAALAAAAQRLCAQDGAPTRAALDLSGAQEKARIPGDFLGLSYEVQQLADPDFFSPSNTGLVRAFREISARGVLRLGGSTSEFGYWKPTAESRQPEHPDVREVSGESKAFYYPVTPQAIRNLSAFLDATGWTCIYGIGMGTNTPARAAAEAAFVAQALAWRLQYFQIGNEPDLFSVNLRDSRTWSFRTYFDEWLSIARAITARVHKARFGLPDVSGAIDWLAEIAAIWPSIRNAPRVTTLSHHHYFGGPATDPEVNIPNLLRPETMRHAQRDAAAAAGAAAKMGLHARMTEGNTCYDGGKPGLSDVFASALWAADYALLLAWSNYSGVNLHGGSGGPVAISVGGSLPGDAMLKERGASEAEIATYPHPFYTPIGSFGSEYKLQPVAYGLKFAGRFCGATLLDADLTARLQAAGVNASAYAARMADGSLSVIVLNKDATRDLTVSADFGSTGATAVRSEALLAPTLISQEARIVARAEPLALVGGKAIVTVPHASGLRLSLSL